MYIGENAQLLLEHLSFSDVLTEIIFPRPSAQLEMRKYLAQFSHHVSNGVNRPSNSKIIDNSVHVYSSAYQVTALQKLPAITCSSSERNLLSEHPEA